MRSLRLLFFPRERYPSFRGRIEVLFGRELIRRGHQIDLVMQADGPDVPPGSVAWSGRTVHVGQYIGGNGLRDRIGRLTESFRHAARQLFAVRPGQLDGILISDQFLLAALALALRPRHRTPVFFWLTFPYHELSALRSRQPGESHRMLHAIAGRVSSWLLYRQIIPRVEHCFVQSPRMAHNLAAEAGHHGKMSSILTGIDMADFPPPRGVQAHSGPFVMAYLGTLVRERQLVILVEMLKLLQDRGLDVQLLLVGDGGVPQDRAEIEEAALRLGVTARLRITGFLPRQEALQIMRDADVGISPFVPDRVQEVASPTKLIEYLALGLPVIANDHPEQKQVVQDSRAGLCVPWGARYFARAVAWLMARSPAERGALGESGREWVMAHRSYKAIADGVERTLLLHSRES
jgi:glycosyltransferase involved in cell wall biosynthesis